MSNNNPIDLTKVKSIAYDIQSNVITILPETMYKFEIIGGSSQDVSVNSEGEILISNFDLFENIEFVKLSDFFNGIQQFIVNNKFTFSEFEQYVSNSDNLNTLKQLVANNLYISENTKISEHKISNLSINNGNLTITLQTGYNNYSAEQDKNVSLNSNVLTVVNLEFYTITSLVNLSEAFNFIQSVVDTNKFTPIELSNYITDNQEIFKTDLASKLYINKYDTISTNKILNISTSNEDNNNQVLISLDTNYIKYDVETYDNVVLEGDGTLVVKNWKYYESWTFAKMNDFYNYLQDFIKTNTFTIDEFNNYVTQNNNELKSNIANKLYILETKTISADKIKSVSFNKTSNTLTVVLSSDYLKYTLPTTNNISLNSTTLTISNLRYYNSYSLINNLSLFNVIQNRISSNKFAPSDFSDDISKNESTIKNLVGQNLYYSPSATLGSSFVSSISLNSSNQFQITLNSDYKKYSLTTANNVSLSNNVIIISNLTFYEAINITGLSDVVSYVQNFITTNTYTPSQLTSYLNSNLSTFKTNIANRMYYTSNITTSSTKFSSSQITGVSLNSSNQLQITLNSSNKKYTIQSTTNVSLSNTKITISNLTFYTSISFSGLDTIRNKFQELITNNSFTANDFTIYNQNNNTNLKNIFINNLTTSTSGPGSWSSSRVSSLTFNGSSISASLTLPTNYKYSWTSVSNVSWNSSTNTFTFSNFSWYSASSSSYFNFSGTILTSLTSSGKQQSSLTIPNTCTEIAANVFKDNGTITSITIPSSVRIIRYSAFENAWRLSSVTIREGVWKIEGWAFKRCAFQSITLPKSVTQLDNNVFDSNSNLWYIYFNSTSITLGDRAISYCSNLRGIYFYNITSTSYLTYNSWAFADNGGATNIYAQPAVADALNRNKPRGINWCHYI
ncbi:MAG: leucine-rich repeat domain-containing protein [Ureaplasma sp.]|nr:leucine-rich repeat domain-containing protein [Ureaplasma sp.]